LGLLSSLAEFEDPFIDVLRPGNHLFLSPGFIHAVITIGNSAMFTLNLMRDNWEECGERQLPIEIAFLQMLLEEKGEKTKVEIIYDSWKRDLPMLQRLAAEDGINGQPKVMLQSIINRLLEHGMLESSRQPSAASHNIIT